VAIDDSAKANRELADKEEIEIEVMHVYSMVLGYLPIDDSAKANRELADKEEIEIEVMGKKEV
jgi:hypothetical protein